MDQTGMEWVDDKEIVKWYKKHKHDEDFLVDLPPYEDAQWALWSLRSGGYNVTIASDREPELLQITTQWLSDNHIDYDAIHIGPTEKGRIAESASPDNPVAFIDDNPKNAKELPRPGATVYLLDRPWNQDVKPNANVVRVKSWVELLSHFPAVNRLAPVRMNGHSNGVTKLITKEEERGSDGKWVAGGGPSGGGGKPSGGKLPAPKAGDHVRVRQWSDGKWRIQHKDANQKVVDKTFQSRTEAIQHAHAQGWTARTGTKVIHPGQAIPPEPPPKPGSMQHAAGLAVAHQQATVGAMQTPEAIKPPAGMLISAMPKDPNGASYIQFVYQKGLLTNDERNALLKEHAQYFAYGSSKPTGNQPPPLSAAEIAYHEAQVQASGQVKPGTAGGPFKVPNAPLSEKPLPPAAPPPPQQFKTEMQFKVAAGAGERVRAAADAKQSTMTPTAKAAIHQYTGSWYSHINGALRGGIESAADTKNIAAMDAALGQSATPENVIVGRTVGQSVIDKFVTAGVGGKVTDHGYVSTSLYKSGTNESQKPITIQVPKGSPGLFIMGISNYGEGESEFLMPRGSQFQVLSTGNGHQVTVMYLGTHLSENKPDVANALTATQVAVNPVATGPSTGTMLNPKIPSLQSAIGAGATKIEGPHGSQPGQWYKMPSGQEVYVKPMSVERAQNEVGARLAYSILGKAAPGELPTTQVVQDKATGQTYVASPKISGLQTFDGKEWALAAKESNGGKTPGATQEAQKQWATDVLLSHWDAVGLAHDNLAIGPSGGATRIDTGGAMAFRAQGADKGTSWQAGGPWKEAYTMRGIGANPQASNVFGRMTNAQAAEALGKLYNSTTHADLQMLRQAWNDSGMPKAQIDKNIGVIVDRLNRIPDLQKELMASPGTTAAG